MTINYLSHEDMNSRNTGHCQYSPRRGSAACPQWCTRAASRASHCSSSDPSSETSRHEDMIEKCPFCLLIFMATFKETFNFKL